MYAFFLNPCLRLSGTHGIYLPAAVTSAMPAWFTLNPIVSVRYSLLPHLQP